MNAVRSSSSSSSSWSFVQALMLFSNAFEADLNEALHVYPMMPPLRNSLLVRVCVRLTITAAAAAAKQRPARRRGRTPRPQLASWRYVRPLCSCCCCCFFVTSIRLLAVLDYLLMKASRCHPVTRGFAAPLLHTHATQHHVPPA